MNAKNLTWHRGETSPEERARRFGHGAACLWLTGLSGSGKSTLAHRIERLLIERGAFAYAIDGDNLRHGLNRDLGFEENDRRENIRRAGELARLFVEAGAIAITAFISPYRADRAAVRALLSPPQFIEVHVATPIEVCEARDPKGLYRRARAGEIADFTGVSAPYEEPEAPELRIDTSASDLDACAARVLDHLETIGILRPQRT
jgi:adenylylsulfate kinase